jgi:outer membrane protein assembly factor BamB
MGRHGWLGALAITAAMAMAGVGAAGASAADEMTTAFGPATHSSAIRDAAIVPPMRAAWDVTLVPNVAAPKVRPLVAGGHVLVQLASTLFSLDATTGAVQWQQAVTGELRAYDQGRVYVSGDQELLTALDAATGTVLWQRRYDDGVGGYPALDASDGRIYVDGNRWIRALDGATGDIVWNTSTDFPGQVVDGVPATDGSRVYVPAESGAIAEFDAATGAPLRVPPPEDADVNTYGGDIGVVGDRVYVRSGGGLWVRDRETGDGVAGPGAAPELPAVGAGVLVGGTDGHVVYGRSATTLLPGWQLDRHVDDGGPSFGAKLIVQRTAYMTTTDGRLLGLDLADGSTSFCAHVKDGPAFDNGTPLAQIAAGDGTLVWVDGGRVVGFRHVDGYGEDCLAGLPRTTWTVTAPLAVDPLTDDAPAPQDPQPDPPTAPAAPAAAAAPAARPAPAPGTKPAAPVVAKAAKVTPPCTATRAGRLTCTLGLAARTSVAGVLRKDTKVVGRATARADKGGRVVLSVRTRRLATGTYSLTITYKKSPRARAAIQRRISLVVG